MKVRNKVVYILIIAVVVFVLFSQLIFHRFFYNYLLEQERELTESVVRSTTAYLHEREAKYLGIVNDWGHWDDTYHYIQGSNREYAKMNLTAETYQNLDVNFILFSDNDGRILYLQYYELEDGNYAALPLGFEEGIRPLLGAIKVPEGGTSGLVKIGEHFYFLAAEKVRDSLRLRPAVGFMVVGRRIDRDIIGRIEDMTGSEASFSVKEHHSDTAQRIDTNLFVEQGYAVEFTEDTEFLHIKIGAAEDGNTYQPVQLTLDKARSLISEGKREINRFMTFYIHGTLVIAAIMFILLGRFISKPFDQLIRDVKALEAEKPEKKRLEAGGNDEFAFLRESLNSLLSRIEDEQSKVKENEEKLYSTLISVGDGVIAVDKDSRVELINPVAERLTGWGAAQARGESIDTVFTIINEYTRERIVNPINTVFATGEIAQLDNHTFLIAKDGRERIIEDTAAPIRDKTGDIVGAVLVFRDYSEKIEKQKQVEYLSYHDQLTGLFNRRFFEEELLRLDIPENLPLSLVFADVNGLKTINDAFGHHWGDELLKKVAEVFKESCRVNDIIARTGGDEFIILLPQTDSPVTQRIINRINARMEKETIMNIKISISYGWSTKTRGSQSASAIMKNAEALMYQRKIFESNSKRSAVIKSILHTLHLKSPRENEHSKRVSYLCESIGRAYDLGGYDLIELRVAGELHDIGKITVDEAILNKPEPLSEAEWAEVKKHPETGYRLLGTSSEYYNVAEYVFAHHEKWDGTGYPKGLKGDQINWKARVIALADAYDAMTSGRPYRRVFSVDEAVTEIKKEVGIRFDPNVARVFIEKVLGLPW